MELNLGGHFVEKETISMVLMCLSPRLFISCKEMKGNYIADNSDNSLTNSSKITPPVRGLLCSG